jgi:hypothetical protein
MKSEIGSTRQDLVALSEEAGADAKLIQHEPLGFAYPCRHPIPTVLHGAQLQGKKQHGALFIILITLCFIGFITTPPTLKKI